MLWPLVAVAVVLVALAYLFDEHHPLDALPGPPRVPVLGCVPYIFRLTPRQMFLWVRENVQKYGDKYCLKIFHRRIMHIHSPEDIEMVLSHSKNLQKGALYRFLVPWLGTGLLVSSGSKWLKRRKILTPTFHFNVLKSFFPVMEEKARGLVARLADAQGREVDLYPVVSDFTLYTICETAMGTQLDSDRSAGAVAYKAAIMEITALLMRRATKAWLHSDLIFRSLPIGKEFEKLIQTIHGFCDNVILERKRKKGEGTHQAGPEMEKAEGNKRRVAMLDLLLEAESKGEIDLEGIREEVNTFMFEGLDTTAAAITFGLMLLADHEDVQEEIFQECQAAVGGGGGELNLSDLSELKYLDAVIKETLRLYPSAPFIVRTITEDFAMGDLRIKKGCEVAVLIYDLHRRRDLYPEPERFRPERFLGGGRRHPYAFVPFSAGPRNCIGQRFAMLEMKCVLAEICRKFRLRPREAGWRPALISDIVLRANEPVYVSFVER